MCGTKRNVSSDLASPERRSRIALIAVDLDGTLLRSDHTPAPEGVRALAAASERGVAVVISTTRNLDSVRRFASEIGLDQPVICTNGAHILATPDGPTWIRRTIPSDLARALMERADVEGWSLITTVDEITYYRRQGDEPLGGVRPGRTIVACNAGVLDRGDPIRILNYEPAAIPEICTFLASHFPGHYHLETYLHPDDSVKSIGIYAAGSDKGTALSFVLDRLGLRPAHVMAIGDNPNDLPMFRCAVVRVAMGNATQDVRAAATVMAPTNDAEGVAWAVRRYVLEKER